ncbi:MAG: LysM peptidoglycan-binding domain-containing protein [Planctomycetaceae bacterium]
MQRDKVLGLSLAILLIGFAGAFCFRNETGSIFNGPQLQNPSALDKAISDKEGPKPYTGNLDSGSFTSKKPEATPTGVTLEGIEADTPFASSNSDEPARPAFTNENASKRNNWETPDYYRPENNSARRPDTRPQQSNSRPVSVSKGQATRSNDVWLPRKNQGWETDSTDDGNYPHAMNSDDDMPPQLAGMHRVQPGDTLTGIASHYLGSSSRYIEIFDANRDTLRTPNDLRAGMMLRIPAQSRSARQRNPQSSGTEAYNFDRQGTSPQNSRNSGASMNRRIESTSVGFQQPRSGTSGGADALGRLPSKKFVPVSRSPFSPRTLQGDPMPTKPRPLSQVPPGDLPDMRMQYFPKGEQKDETSEMQIIPMQTPPKPSAATGRLHRVKRGETLESIALKTYGSRAKSQRIFDANRDRLRSPDGLREGITILLP